MRLLVLLALLVVPSMASAITMDYHTYNAFNETVGGFLRLALIASDPAFMYLAFALVGVSYAIATLVYVTKGYSGQMAKPQALFVPALVGLCVFLGGIVPKGTIHVYDPITNQTQAIGGIPNLIVALAGSLSSFEEAVVGVVDTAALSGSTPYADTAGPMSFTLIYNAMNAKSSNPNLEKTIGQYYTDCVLTGIATNRNGLSDFEVQNGTSDMVTTFAKANHPAWPTVFYMGDDGKGTEGYCSDSWTYINSVISNDTTMDPMTRIICAQSGFNVADAAQLAICKTRIGEAADLGFGEASLSSAAFLRNFIMSRGISAALNSADYSLTTQQLVSRQLMAEGMGSSEAMGQWVPKLRGFLVATVLGLTAILLLFVATPLTVKVLALIFGLFMWLSMWGVTDVLMVTMAKDQAVAAFSQIRDHHLAFDAIMSSPDGAVQSLAIFGKARSMALMLSTVVCTALFGFGGYALVSYAQGLQGHLDQVGEQAGRRSVLPEEQASLQSQLNSAPGTMAQVATHGYGNVAAAANRPGMQSVSDLTYISDSLSTNGGGLSQFYSDTAQKRGGSELGDLRGAKALADHRGQPLGSTADDVAYTSGLRSNAATLKAGEVAKELDGGIIPNAEASGAMDASRNYAGRKSAEHVPGEAPASPGAFGKLSEYDNAARDGTVSGSGGDPNKLRKNYDWMTQTAIANTETLGDRVKPQDVGRAQAIDTAVHTRGQEHYLAGNPGGENKLVDGAEFRVGEGAGVGVGARAVGDPGSVGEHSGAFNTVSAAGRYTSQERIAQMVTGQNGYGGLFKYSKLSNSEGSTVLKGEPLQAMLGRIVEREPERAAWAEKVAMIGAARVDFGVSEDGTMTNVNIRGGFESYNGNFNSQHDGYSAVDEKSSLVRRSDDEILSATRAAQGGNQLLSGDNVQTLLKKAYSTDGEVDKGWLGAFGQGYSGALHERGLSLGSVTSESFSKALKGDMHIGADGRVEGGLSIPLVGGVKTALSAGVSGSAGLAKTWDEQSAVTTDGNILASQALGASSIATARLEYENDHGALPAQGTPARAQADEWIYGRASDHFKSGFETLAAESRKQGDHSLEGQTPVESVEDVVNLAKANRANVPDASIGNQPGEDTSRPGSWTMH